MAEDRNYVSLRRTVLETRTIRMCKVLTLLFGVGSIGIFIIENVSVIPDYVIGVIGLMAAATAASITCSLEVARILIRRLEELSPKEESPQDN